MRISQNKNYLPSIYNSRRDISQASERPDKFRNGQTIVLKRNHPFQHSYPHQNLSDTDMNVYNITNKVEPLRKNSVGMLIDIYA